MGRSMIEATPDVRATALLPSLENQSPDAPDLAPLRLQPLMDIALRPIEQEQRRSAALRADFQTAPGVVLKIVLEPLPNSDLLFT